MPLVTNSLRVDTHTVICTEIILRNQVCTSRRPLHLVKNETAVLTDEVACDYRIYGNWVDKYSHVYLNKTYTHIQYIQIHYTQGNMYIQFSLVIKKLKDMETYFSIPTSGHVEILRVECFVTKQCKNNFNSKRTSVYKISIKQLPTHTSS